MLHIRYRILLDACSVRTLPGEKIGPVHQAIRIKIGRRHIKQRGSSAKPTSNHGPILSIVGLANGHLIGRARLAERIAAEFATHRIGGVAHCVVYSVLSDDGKIPWK